MQDILDNPDIHLDEMFIASLVFDLIRVSRSHSSNERSINQLTLCGSRLQFVQSLKYLGAQFVAAKKCTCSVDKVKVNFCRVFNAIFSRSKGAQSEMVALQLFKSYCLPFMLYATEVMPLSDRLVQTLCTSGCGKNCCYSR